MQMKSKLKNQKGIMTVYVVTMVLTFLIVLTTLFSVAVATRKNEVKTLIKIKEVYERNNDKKEDIDEEQRNKLMTTEDTIPYYPDETFKKVSNTNLNNGLVIKDTVGNEYVWIEVPKSLYGNSEYNTETIAEDKKPTSSVDYEKIEYCLQQYLDYYRRDKNGNLTNYKDTYYSEEIAGLTEEQYYNLKKKMLKSVYENGGFWIGKYEAGIKTNRTSNTTTEEIPLSQEGTVENPVYPYNCVTCSQAQNLANNLTTTNYTSSLMFGIQWDLVLKHIETKTKEAGVLEENIRKDLKTDSTNWGNYRNSGFTINRGRYADFLNGALSTVWTPYNETTSNAFVNNNKQKQIQSTEGKGILLTTGASDTNKKMNIYDLAGNVWELTLEYNSANIAAPCLPRGGSFYYSGADYSAHSHGEIPTGFSSVDIGFRVSIYK